MSPRAKKFLACMLLIGCGAAGVGARGRGGCGYSWSDTTAAEAFIIPAVILEKDRRTTPSQNSRASPGATGLVRCGAAIGTAQLTLKNDVITTAAHVLMGPDGRPRTGCVFEAIHGHDRVPIDPTSIRPEVRFRFSTRVHSWAVAPLGVRHRA